MRCAISPRYDASMILRLALLAAASILLVSVSLGEPVYPPGSRIGLEPPPGMVPSGTGFTDRARGAMLMVTELSAQSYARVM